MSQTSIYSVPVTPATGVSSYWGYRLLTNLSPFLSPSDNNLRMSNTLTHYMSLAVNAALPGFSRWSRPDENLQTGFCAWVLFRKHMKRYRLLWWWEILLNRQFKGTFPLFCNKILNTCIHTDSFAPCCVDGGQDWARTVPCGARVPFWIVSETPWAPWDQCWVHLQPSCLLS